MAFAPLVRGVVTKPSLLAPVGKRSPLLVLLREMPGWRKQVHVAEGGRWGDRTISALGYRAMARVSVPSPQLIYGPAPANSSASARFLGHLLRSNS
jgi:hypothetical protein